MKTITSWARTNLWRAARARTRCWSRSEEKFTPEVIAKLPPSIRIIATYSVGYDHIDLPAAKARGIRVANTPDAVTVATAEIAMLLMLGAARRAQEGERLLREKKWGGWQPMQLIGRRLDGKRLGIYGMGKIGQATAKRARAFDMEIHYHNRRRLTPAEEQGAIYHATLDSLLGVSEFLSVNAPSTPETRGVLNASAFAKLPRGAIVVNTARGDLINDGDLIAALKSGQVGYVGLDVFAGEPNIHPGYYGLENVFVLPHMGTSAIEARDEMGFAALDNTTRCWRDARGLRYWFRNISDRRYPCRAVLQPLPSPHITR